ncbi:MAG: homoserine kinase [Leptospiraceae bacterium]|nr:MAG: homoserine kinase [Leptospiraceae bacterium]
MKNLLIRIPATTANLGPGFDLFGMALDLYNYIEFEFNPNTSFEIYNIDGNKLPFSNLHKNLIYQSYKNVLLKYNYREEELPKWKVTIYMDVSTGKGFGSSATAIVAGVQAAKVILQKKQIQINLEQEIQYFLELENHPDNVVPARIGGWVFCYNSKHIIKKEVPEDLGLCALIPDFEISTDDSRKKLKTYYNREEVLSNMKGCLLWLEYLHSRNPEYLIYALQSDKLHEPVRYAQLPFIKEIKNYIQKIGCYGMSLSGSGPSLIIYYDKQKDSYFKEQLSKLNQLLNHQKKHKFLIKFCLPDYTGLIVYPETMDIRKIVFQNSEIY